MSLAAPLLLASALATGVGPTAADVQAAVSNACEVLSATAYVPLKPHCKAIAGSKGKRYRCTYRTVASSKIYGGELGFDPAGAATRYAKTDWAWLGGDARCVATVIGDEQ